MLLRASEPIGILLSVETTNSATTISALDPKSSQLSDGVQQFVTTLCDARPWRWFVTGTYHPKRARLAPERVLGDFKAWLRDAALESAWDFDSGLVRKEVRARTNLTPTITGHKLAAKARLSQWQGKAKRKWSNGKWRADYVVSVEPHQSDGLHWHAVISDPQGYPLDFHCLRLCWLHNGRIDVREINKGGAEDPLGYALKSLSYTLKESQTVEFSEGVANAMAVPPGQPCLPSII